MMHHAGIRLAAVLSGTTFVMSVLCSILLVFDGQAFDGCWLCNCTFQ